MGLIATHALCCVCPKTRYQTITAVIAMSSIHTYLPLYRRYRPQAFTDLVGQEVICQTLGNAILHDQVAHAYLFCGPRGTGKTSTARIFAKALNCTHQQPGANPCNQCDSCQSITLGNALDVIEFDAASNNKVEDARELIEGCQFAPMSGGYKVYIIDEVHMLTTQAFNTLLKTLEEPPPNVIFIFATTEAHKVLPTIVSRCQRFDFSRIDSATIVKRLQTIAQVEQIAITDAALLRVARQAHGGLRDAVGLLDQLSVLARAEAGKTVDVADVALLVGAVQEDRLLALSQAMANYQAQGVLDTVSGLLADGIEPSQLVRDLTQHFRNLLIVQVSGIGGAL
jgi:DNA polymerase-3 subunit gamma/tau